MSNPSKIKGSAYELKIAKILTDYFKIKFERVPMSGSLPYLKGDIWTMTHYDKWDYCIECKHYAKLDFNNLLTAKSNNIYSFWDQAVEEAKTMQKKPLVCFHWNRSRNFVLFIDEINLESQIIVKSFGYNFKIGLLEEWLNKINVKL